MAARRRTTRHHQTLACVLRRTAYGESDLIIGLFTEALGQVSVLARSARRSQKRFGGNLEPLHTLAVELDEADGSQLLYLREAQVVNARPHLLEHLGSMEAAGRFLGWIRHAAPERTPEPELWALLQSCLDQLDEYARQARDAARAAAPLSAPSSALGATRLLSAHGLQLLVVSGWRLELEYCVQSGERCPDGKAAMIDPERGGLVSQAHGGAPFKVDGATRKRLIETQNGALALLEQDAALALELVDRCLRAHAGLRS